MKTKKIFNQELKQDLTKGLTIPVFVAIFALAGAAYGIKDNLIFSYAILGGLVGLSWGIAFKVRKKKKIK